MLLHIFQIRDSAALVQFLFWLKREVEAGHSISEIRAQKQIDHCRSKMPKFVSLSFRVSEAKF